MKLLVPHLLSEWALYSSNSRCTFIHTCIHPYLVRLHPNLSGPSAQLVGMTCSCTSMMVQSKCTQQYGGRRAKVTRQLVEIIFLWMHTRTQESRNTIATTIARYHYLQHFSKVSSRSHANDHSQVAPELRPGQGFFMVPGMFHVQ